MSSVFRKHVRVDVLLGGIDPATIGSAMAANKLAYAAMLATLPGASWHDEDELTWFETGVPLDVFNGVVRANLSSGGASTIDRIIRHFDARGLPFHWRLGPASNPADAEILVSGGLVHDEEEPGMACDVGLLAHLPSGSTDVDVVAVDSSALVGTWTEVWGCGAPAWVAGHWRDVYTELRVGLPTHLRFYVGYVDGRPVATAALFLAAGVASIEHVVTIPEFRRRGIGAAMTAKAMEEAQRAGYRVAVLTASDDGLGVYRRLGFREYCTFSTYTHYPSA